jgi:hypothetical protein
MDWKLLKKHLDQPIGTTVHVPDMNWGTFRRIKVKGVKSFTIKNILILDTVNPCPFADYKVLLTLKNDIRKARIIERGRDDSVWKEIALKSWDLHEDDKKNVQFKTCADIILDSNKPAETIADVLLHSFLSHRDSLRR